MNIRIHESILFHGREEIRTLLHLLEMKFTSDESPLYHGSIEYKYYYLIYGREEIRTPGSKKNS